MAAAGAFFGIIMAVLLTLDHFDRLPAFVLHNSEVLIVMCFGVLGGAMGIFDEDQTTIRCAKIKPNLGLF